MRKAKWFELLVEQNEGISVERLESIGEQNGYEILGYVLRTLDALEDIDIPFKNSVKKALQWSEVAKCGSPERRISDWCMFNLSIHNIGSAEIYELYNSDDKDKELVKGLIRYHGTIGQYLRGEVSDIELKGLSDFIWAGDDSDIVARKSAVQVMTKCVISGISEDLWEELSEDANSAIDSLFRREIPNNSISYRLRKMHPGFHMDVNDWEFADVIKNYTFWYPESALGMFTDDVFLKFIELAVKYTSLENDSNCCVDVSFRDIANNMYYDYYGKKKVNIYKQRMVEAYFRDNTSHVRIGQYTSDKISMFSIVISDAASKLIDFFQSAELDGNIEYHKAIVMMCDFLGLRKDNFDRLNNESSYLDTMNDISSSRKGEILDWVVGDSVVDVGSGSGILLDKLEEKYPDKNIIGTDISQEVIDRLKKKAENEGHDWRVLRHNFVGGKLNDTGISCNVDSIIFSSIVHEIFSFSSPRYDISNVHLAFKNAYDSLNPGGRIIIRDGVKTGTGKIVSVYVDEEGLSFFKNFLKDFRGLPDYDPSGIFIDHPARDMVKITGDIDYIREFLYTYTWGIDSYPQEVQEQFGYMTLEEFKEYFRSIGANVLMAEEYLEPGYPENLNVKLFDEETGDEISLPNSNCIVVVEKPE